MSPAHDDDAVPRDAWLREALRHAPDAQAAPPPKLEETILRMGRAAVAPRMERPAASRTTSAAPAGPGALAAFWAWLARPPVAAGFAGLMVATVVGVMWWDRPLEEALPPREETVAAAPAPTAAEAPAQASALPAGLPEAAKRAATAPPADTLARKSSVTPAAPKAEAPPPVPQVAAAPAPVPAAAAETTAREREAAVARMAAPQSMPQAAPSADAAAPGALAGRAAVAAAPAASAFIETPGLSNLRFEIRRQPESWSWQRDEGETRPMDDAMFEWIVQADRTARPSWQAGAVGADQATTTLRFTRGGVVRAVLRLGPGGMRLTRGGKTESVELSRGQMAALQSSLDALGP